MTDEELRLTKADLLQLMNYIGVREKDGWYCGNKEQFEKRHLKIQKWINQQINAATPESAP